MIKPTVGRVLYYNPKPQDNLEQIDDQPLMAFLIAVLKDKEKTGKAVEEGHPNSRVNLFVISASGQTRYLPKVLLWQGEGDRPKGGYAEWMPYQQGQAVKTEQLEQRLHQIQETQIHSDPTQPVV